MLSWILVLAVMLVAVGLGIVLAYFPMQILLTQMARNIRQFIQRQRDRRMSTRQTPDRRHL